MTTRRILAHLLMGVLLLSAAPLLAQWSLIAPPEHLFRTQRFSELEREYARVLAARSRNHWGEFHTEELLRRLHLSLTGASPPEIVKPTPEELDARTQAWLRHSPHSPIARIARACSLLLRAQAFSKARDWGEGEKLTLEARALLEQVRDTARKVDSNWHAAWLYVGKLEGWMPEQVMAAAEDASNTEPRAPAPWLAAVEALSPDGRAPGLLAPLAELAVRRTKSSEGLSFYARIYLRAAKTYGAVVRDPFDRGGVDWPKMTMGLSDWHARYPAGYVLNQHAVLACLARDQANTAALLARIGPNPDHSWWEYWGGRSLFERCREWARSGTI